MITSIRAYKIRVKPLVLDLKRYEKIDITNQLEQPILNSAQRDGVHAASRISLLNNSKKALKQFTRIIIELTDTVNGVNTVEKIYRVVDVDSVTNAARGNEPLYRHTLQLIDPTKILERRVVDNISFTNYLPHNYGISSKVVGFSSESNESSSYDALGTYGVIGLETECSQNNYSNEIRLLGPNAIQNTQINVGWRLSVKGKYYTDTGDIGTIISQIFPSTTTLQLKSFVLRQPNGVEVSIINETAITLSQIGSYYFVQKYAAEFNGNEYLSFIATWRLIVIADQSDAAREYNIADVIDRLLLTQKILTESVDQPEFALDESLHERLSHIEAPEYSFTQCTLFEALCHIGTYIHAIPRLIPKIKEMMIEGSRGFEIVEDDYSDWSVITFDFLDEAEEYSGKVYSLIDIEAAADDYATDFISNVQNATVTNYEDGYSVTVPYDGGFVSVRTDDSKREISDDHAVFKAPSGIRTVLECIIKVPNIGELDITDRILEKKAYDTKLEYNTNISIDSRAYYLYYEEGDNKICGLNYTRPASTLLSQLALRESIKEIITLVDERSRNYTGKIKDISYRLKYIPFNDLKIKQYKSLIDKSADKSTLFYNQQANEVDISYYGEAMHYALMRTGNPKQTPTQYFENLADVPKCGQKRKDGYVAFQVNREIYYRAPIKTTTYWSRYYNELFADIAVKKAVRQFEISEKEPIKRNIDFQEFCVIDTTLDVAPLYKSGRTGDYVSELRSYVEDRISKCSFGTSTTMAAVANRLLNNASAYKPATIAEIKTESFTNGNVEERYFVLPANCFPSGRSAVFYFSFLDNYAAATKAVDSDASFGIEHDIPYVDEYGRFERLSFILAEKITDGQGTTPISEKTLFEGAYTGYNVYADFSAGGYGYYVAKDNREQLSVTGQLNFVTPNKNIHIYRKLIEILPFVGKSNDTLKYVVFFERQNVLDEYVQGEFGTFDENGTMPLIQINALTKHIKINGVVGGGTNCFGFGIISSDGKKCLFVEHDPREANLPPLFLMFRRET